MSLMGLLGCNTQVGKESVRYEIVQKKLFQTNSRRKRKRQKIQTRTFKNCKTISKVVIYM